ncbi:uncharacterized protein SAMN04487943_101257 [Gracilibacillus orientalis]|uniref:DUF418 domain-containing protein n=1 Tax=Gracilibacillus orientalis TaxID=334253 RepID=A0A1I4H6P8_9BACI|nr:DUF418 domain-containing protein [Gracilibacillus orientalis]SFL37934.1 uncharacterized protein SAMN04487943_101257 [Gracilibacillus orientalis]
MNNPSPLADSKRLPWIDTARGFAIFGIFMVNLLSLHGPYFMYGNGTNFWGTGEPGFWQVIIDIFFQASFYSLFSFLFGFGMQIIYKNLLTKNVEAPRKWMVRRLWVLLGFGLIHAFLIWHGDILITYAVIGFLLLLFLNRNNVTLVVWSICILLIPTLLYSGVLFIIRDDISNLANRTAIENANQHYGAGSWGDILSQNANDWLNSNQLINFVFTTFNILPIFLIGLLFAKNKWLHDLQLHKKTLQKWWVGSLILFVLFKAGPYAFGNPIWFSNLQDAVGGISSAIFYTITIAFLYGKGKQLFRLIGYVGKMALSNYILQSIIGVTIFYSIGFGLYGKLTPFQIMLVGLIVYPVQIFLSYLWLKKYKRGPIEWLWRSLLYKKKLTNRRSE